MDKETAIVLTKSKSMGLGLVLTLVFGGLGMFYATIVGGIVMTLLEMFAVLLTILTAGVGIIILIPVHIICIIWTVVAINKHNKKVLAAAGAS